MKLNKRGRMLVASYEAVRCQKLDLFSVTLRQIGAHISRMHLEDAIQVLMEGDGNGNAAPVDSTATEDTVTYEDLVDFWAKFDPYEMNTLLVGNDVMVKMLKLEEFQNPLTGLNFQGTGRLSTPLGASLLRTSAMPAGHHHRPGPAVRPGDGAGQRRAGGVRQAHRPAAGAGGHHHYQRLRQAVPGRGPGAGAVMEEQILAFVELMGGRGNEELLPPPVSGGGAGDGGPAEGGAVPRGVRARLPGGRSLAGAGRTGGRDGRRDLLFRWRPDGTYRRRRRREPCDARRSG